MACVLVADDDADIRALVARRVSQLGHEVIEAVDGQDALERAREEHPDLVVLDWMMPRRTGLDVCREIRADAELGRLPVILLSARAQDDDLERAFSAGADAYIIKPFRASELQQRVTSLLAS